MSPLAAILLLAFMASPEPAAATTGWHVADLHSDKVNFAPRRDLRKLQDVPSDSSPEAFDGHTAQPAVDHSPSRATVAEWKFEPTRDEEIYRLPPGWTQRHGPGFPRYVQFHLDDERPPPGGRCLHVDLNGGAASAFGPAITLQPGVDYLLDGFIKTSDLEHDAAGLSLTFLDSARQKLTSPTSALICGTSGWQKVRVGPLAPPARASSLVVGIHVSPRGEVQDFHGAAAFGALWLGHVPRLVMTARPVEDSGRRSASKDKSDGPTRNSMYGAGGQFRVFARGKPIEVACLVTGFNAESTATKREVRLTLENVAGRTLAQHTETLATIPAQTAPATSKVVTGGRKAISDARALSSACTTWQIPSESVGYYRITAKVVSFSNREDSPLESAPHATLGLAIIDRESPSANSEFGWSLDSHDTTLGLVPLGDLLAQAGVRSVKFPFICSFAVEPALPPPTRLKKRPASGKPSAAHRPPRSKNPTASNP